MPRHTHKYTIALVLSLAIAACGGKQEAKKEYVVLADYVATGDTLFPRLRFLADGLLSPNDRCPVRKVKLNPKMMAVYVNGSPIGFC